MNEKDKHISKEISDLYVTRKQKQMKQIEESNEKFKELIGLETLKLEDNKKNLEKVEFENNILKDEYNSLKRVIKERGLIIDISNDNYSLREWDNLTFHREGKSYVLSSKKGEVLKVFDVRTSDILEEIRDEYGNYSAIVVRVLSKFIRIQIRLVKENS